MFTLHISSRLQKESVSYLVNKPFSWFNTGFVKTLTKIIQTIGEIDYTVDYTNNVDLDSSQISVYFIDTDQLLDKEKNEKLLAIVYEDLKSVLFETDTKRANQVYLYSAKQLQQKRKEIYDKVITEQRLIDGIVNTYVFEHPETNTVLVYHSSKPLRFNLENVSSVDGPYLQHFKKDVDTGIHLETQLQRVTTITYYQVKEVGYIYEFYDQFKLELALYERLLNAPYIDQDNPKVTDKDKFIKVSTLFKFKPNDPHALRLVEHSILHHQLPYFVVKSDSNLDTETQYFYIDGSKTRIEKIPELQTKIPDMEVLDIKQHSTDTKTIFNGYGLLLMTAKKSKENIESELLKVLLYLEEGIVNK